MIRLHLRSAISAILPLVAISAHATWTVKAFKVEGATRAHITHGNATQQVGFAILNGKQVGGIWTGTDASWVSLLPSGATGCHIKVITGGRQYGDTLVNNQDQAGYWTGTANSWVSLHPPGTFSSSVQDAQENLVLIQGTLAPGGLYGPILHDTSTGTTVSLRPEGASGAIAVRMHNGKQVGTASGHTAGFKSGAALWSGTSASYVSLHPEGFFSSLLSGIWGNQQVGSVFVSTGVKRAGLWTGTAASWVDLHPAGYKDSQAHDVWNGIQIGTAQKDRIQRAGLWRGTAASWVDLHALTPGYSRTQASRIWSDGKKVFIGGHGWNEVTKQIEGLLWSQPVQ